MHGRGALAAIALRQSLCSQGDHNDFPRAPGARKPNYNARVRDGVELKPIKTWETILVVAGVAFLMAVLIWERASWDNIHVAFWDTLSWQLLVWLPWLAIIPLIGISVDHALRAHLLRATALITAHYFWFRWISSQFSPFVGHPDTLYGVFAYFFLFWTLMDLAFYAIVLAVVHVRSSAKTTLTDETRERSGQTGEAQAVPEGWSVLKNGVRHWVKSDSVHWIEAHGYYARLHTDVGDFLLRESLADLQEALEPEGFVRVHRSTLVRLDRIAQLSRHEKGYWQVQLRDGEVRRVSRGGRRQLRARMGQTTEAN